jgi:hypothetical protein
MAHRITYAFPYFQLKPTLIDPSYAGNAIQVVIIKYILLKQQIPPIYF